MKLEMNRTKLSVSAVALTISALVLTAELTFPTRIFANDDDFENFTVDVTQDDKTYGQNNVDPSKPQDSLSRGDTFMADGALYPGRTLKAGSNQDPGPNDHPIGSYRQRGTTLLKNTEEFLRAVAGDTTAPDAMFFATEEFSFGDGNTILTEGIWPNAHRSAVRVVIGGTGRFRGVVGEEFIVNIGEGTNKFCNARVTFKIRKAWLGHDR